MLDQQQIAPEEKIDEGIRQWLPGTLTEIQG